MRGNMVAINAVSYPVCQTVYNILLTVLYPLTFGSVQVFGSCRLKFTMHSAVSLFAVQDMNPDRMNPSKFDKRLNS